MRADPSGKHVRLEVNSYLKDQKSGAVVVYKYTGIVNVTEEVAAVLGMYLSQSLSIFSSCPVVLERLTGSFYDYRRKTREEDDVVWRCLWVIWPTHTYLLDRINGIAVTHVVFETGSEKLKEMELKIYVASGRFIIEGEKTTVEYKISEVASS